MYLHALLNFVELKKKFVVRKVLLKTLLYNILINRGVGRPLNHSNSRHNKTVIKKNKNHAQMIMFVGGRELREGHYRKSVKCFQLVLSLS